MSDEIKQSIAETAKLVADIRSEVAEIKGAGDVISREKIERMEKALGEALATKAAVEARLAAVETAAARPLAMKGEAPDELRAAFKSYLRDPSETNRLAYEAKSVNGSTGSQGGVLVAPTFAADLNRIALDNAVVRSLAKVVAVSSPDYNEIIDQMDQGVGIVGEMDTRTETAAGTFAKVTPTHGEIYANAATSNHILKDALYDVEGNLLASIARKMGVYEDQLFVSGTGVGRPTGLLNGSTIGVVKTGVAGDFSSKAFDDLTNLKYSVKAEYAANGTFLLNSTVAAKLAKVTNLNGDYLWRQSVVAGEPDAILGRPVAISEAMPAIAASSKSILFGDFKRGYVITDIPTSVELIVDKTTNKGFTIFYVSKRVGGCVLDANALKALQFAV